MDDHEFWCYNCKCAVELLQKSVEEWVCFRCASDDIEYIDLDTDED